MASTGSSSGAAASSASAAAPPWRFTLADKLKQKDQVINAVQYDKTQSPLKEDLELIAMLEAKLDAAQADKQTLDGQLASLAANIASGTGDVISIGNTSFRGAKEPTLYVRNHPNYPVVGNYTIQGYRFRNTGNSHSAVLSAMRTRRANIGQILNNAKNKNDKLASMESEMANLMKQYVAAINKLLKDAADQARRFSSASSAAARSGYKPAPLAPSSARAAFAATAPQQAPTLGQRFTSFFSRKPAAPPTSGGTRKRRGSRKTRRGNRK